VRSRTSALSTELLKNLLYYVAKSHGDQARVCARSRSLYRLDEALPGDALVSEERARMSGPDREAMKSVVDALCEELARAKDALDLFVRSTERKLPELGPAGAGIKAGGGYGGSIGAGPAAPHFAGTD
jgi:chemosensory pili system protein ChpA (sensor histidine kinase/response regulator)